MPSSVPRMSFTCGAEKTLDERLVRAGDVADPVRHLGELVEERRGEHPAVVREEPHDDQVLVAEEPVHVVQRLDERMILRKLASGSISTWSRVAARLRTRVTTSSAAMTIQRRRHTQFA